MQPGRDATAPDGLGRVDVEVVASQPVEQGFEPAGGDGAVGDQS